MQFSGQYKKIINFSQNKSERKKYGAKTVRDGQTGIKNKTDKFGTYTYIKNELYLQQSVI